MKLTALREYHLGSRLGQVRSVPVRLAGRPENAVLFVYSSQPNIDPWPELFDFPKDTLKMALFSESGMLLWERDLGTGVIPGSGSPPSSPSTWTATAPMKSGCSTTSIPICPSA